MRNEPFVPYASQTVATSTTSAATALTAGSTVRLVNLDSTSTDIVYVALGDAGVVATANSIALMPGQSLYLSRQANPQVVPNALSGGFTYVALIAAANTPNVNITTGEAGGGAGS